jgi:tetratricopeptide (TPR) repeat protein
VLSVDLEESSENRFRVSKFSKSYYIYLTSICRGAIDPSNETLTTTKEKLQKIISLSSQKDGIIERFLTNRCTFTLPDDERDSLFWRLLCYEIMYLWNLIGSCSRENIEAIIEDCKCIDEKSEPILGLSQFLMGACYAIINDDENAIKCYTKCIEAFNDPSNLSLTYVPAYANYELAVVFIRSFDDDKKEEIQKLLQNAQSWKNFDFEHRLKLKIHSVKFH